MYLKETLLRVQFALAVLNSTREQQQTCCHFSKAPCNMLTGKSYQNWVLLLISCMTLAHDLRVIWNKT